MNEKARPPLHISEVVHGMEKFSIWFHDPEMNLSVHLARGGLGRGICPIERRTRVFSGEQGPGVGTKNTLRPKARMWNLASHARKAPISVIQVPVGANNTTFMHLIREMCFGGIYLQKL